MSAPVPQTRKAMAQLRVVSTTPESSQNMPDMRAWIKKEVDAVFAWHKKEVDATLARHEARILALIKAEVNIYCHSVFPSDEEHFTVEEKVEDEFLMAMMPPSPPKLVRE